MHTIKFGTDGWRAIIGDTYTFENVARVAQATAQWLAKTFDAPRVVLGYDTRFQGRAFAEQAARVLAANGVPVIFGETYCTTPAISWAAKAYGCSAGVVITASHNPPEYNGFKIKSEHGGPASPAQIAEVEAELPRLSEREAKSFAAYVEGGLIELRDVRADYEDMLRERIDIEAIKAAGLKVAHDAMYGAGQGAVVRLLGEAHVVPLHHDLNPGFHGRAPEPIERNLGRLAEAVTREGCDVGLANDGDADRIGMYDETGRFVSSHELLALLVKYLHEERGLSGTVIKTFSTTGMLDKMAAQYGLPLETTKIGFKYIGPMIVEGDVLVGGEESGGIAVKGHIPERDGLFIGLLITEMVAGRGKPLSALVQELFDAYGEHHTYREDVHTTDAKKRAVLDRLAKGGLEEIAGMPVERVDDLDGYKHLGGSGWLLVRPSGTEPVLRVYSEAPTHAQAVELVQDARRQLGVD